MNAKKVFILVDYRGSFYSSTRETAGSMDVERVKALLEKRDYAVKVEGYSEVDLRSERYQNSFILYQSSEDPDLRYKDYIEDILIGLELRGAILIPDFHKFRAHHNKIFMEILRDVSGYRPIQNIESLKFGTLNELKVASNNVPLPAIIKPGAGSKSCGVSLGFSLEEVYGSARKIARSLSLTNLRRMVSGMFNGKGYRPISNFRNKFIVQDYIDGLRGDYKILVYGNKFFVLERLNRKGDFRASGSGRLSFPRELPDGLLDYVEAVFSFFNTPFASFDVATKDGQFYLLEFQFLSFGQYAIEKSTFFFRRLGPKWQAVDQTSDLEETFVEAVCDYLSLQEVL